MRDTRLVIALADGSAADRELMGNKGANLGEMTRLLGAQVVPAGFTVTTAACLQFLKSGGGDLPGSAIVESVEAALAELEADAGMELGDPDSPLLLSVRSGGRVSMPGMMETVLDIGLNDATVEGLAARSNDRRFAWDSYRRLVQMYAGVVIGVPNDLLEAEMSASREVNRTRIDADLGSDELRSLVDRFKALCAEHGDGFPEDARTQLLRSVAAVFSSWNGQKAIDYRRIHGIPDDWGTAATVQRMVFGNLGGASGSGVAFSRDEVTGGPEPSGDFLDNAQGEDVVSGSRNTRPLAELAAWAPEADSGLRRVLTQLERHFDDMQDVEFTIESGRLFILQTRSAKRHAQAAVRFACDAVEEELLDRAQALLTIDASSLDGLLHPRLARPISDAETIAKGVAASPGAAAGEIVFTATAAIAASEAGRDTILVRRRTEADDVAGFHAARGILTSTGGKASHAALVARGMGRPCVCGADGLEVDEDDGVLRVVAGGRELHEGDVISIDGSSGRVTDAAIELAEPEPDERFNRVLGWADEMRRLGVRANADSPEDARRARTLGAEGIGLCRTEHMFMAADRQPLMRAMILASDEEERRAVLDRLLPLQQGDFEGLFHEMRGLPVTIRLLDPPLHEFLRTPAELERLITAAEPGEASELGRELERTLELAETNPMLGTRGVRLGMLHPEIPEVQIRAMCRAVRTAAAAGLDPQLQIMVPLVAWPEEIAAMRQLAESIAGEERLSECPPVGTMIELPRACLVADLIAEQADFFSFGTNDLTQTAIGISRDDVEATLLRSYRDSGLFARSPFETIDAAGVGVLVEQATLLGRSSVPGLDIGICGEHGGDPESIAFFESAELDYVSCSPFRIPIARVAAAQAAIRAA